jgi:hypothetical protein
VIVFNHKIDEKAQGEEELVAISQRKPGYYMHHSDEDIYDQNGGLDVGSKQWYVKVTG